MPRLDKTVSIKRRLFCPRSGSDDLLPVKADMIDLGPFFTTSSSSFSRSNLKARRRNAKIKTFFLLLSFHPYFHILRERPPPLIIYHWERYRFFVSIIACLAIIEAFSIELEVSESETKKGKLIANGVKMEQKCALTNKSFVLYN